MVCAGFNDNDGHLRVSMGWGNRYPRFWVPFSPNSQKKYLPCIFFAFTRDTGNRSFVVPMDCVYTGLLGGRLLGAERRSCCVICRPSEVAPPRMARRITAPEGQFKTLDFLHMAGPAVAMIEKVLPRLFFGGARVRFWHEPSVAATARVGPEVGVELPMVRAGH